MLDQVRPSFGRIRSNLAGRCPIGRRPHSTSQNFDDIRDIFRAPLVWVFSVGLFFASTGPSLFLFASQCGDDLRKLSSSSLPPPTSSRGVGLSGSGAFESRPKLVEASSLCGVKSPTDRESSRLTARPPDSPPDRATARPSDRPRNPPDRPTETERPTYRPPVAARARAAVADVRRRRRRRPAAPPAARGGAALAVAGLRPLHAPRPGVALCRSGSDDSAPAPSRPRVGPRVDAESAPADCAT